MADTNSHILVIDDDDLLRNSISGALAAAGYEITTAKDGQEGLNLALKKQPSLILLDYQMPILDGLGMLKKLREDVWGKTADVILATNVYDLNLMNAVLELGVNEYILKSSTSLDEIVALVKEHLALKT